MRLVCALLVLFSLTTGRAMESPAFVPEIPFQLRDGFIWIQVTVAGAREPLHFLLDSGAEVSVIDTATAERLGLKRGRKVAVAGVGSATSGFWPQTLEARAGTVPLPRSYLMLDLHQLSQACTNAPVDGVIGADFFRDRIVQIDYQKQTVRLLPAPPAEAGMEILPLKVRRCGMLVSVRVNDGPAQWVRLDTGCASALQWIAPDVRPERRTGRVAFGLAPISLAVAQTTLTLGTIQFKNVPTDLPQQESFPGEKGLLGNGILSRCKAITIDAKGGRLFVLPAQR